MFSQNIFLQFNRNAFSLTTNPKLNKSLVTYLFCNFNFLYCSLRSFYELHHIRQITKRKCAEENFNIIHIPKLILQTFAGDKKAYPEAIFTIMPVNKYDCDLLSIYLLLILHFGNNADDIYHAGHHTPTSNSALNTSFN